jgi:hypothetical protein
MPCYERCIYRELTMPLESKKALNLYTRGLSILKIKSPSYC